MSEKSTKSTKNVNRRSQSKRTSLSTYNQVTSFSSVVRKLQEKENLNDLTVQASS